MSNQHSVQMPGNPINTGDDPAHVASMVAKAAKGVDPHDSAPAPSDGPDQKPEWLGDFEKPEDLAKAYNELRSKMSREGAPKEEPKGAPAEAETPAAEADAQEAAEKAGLDLQTVEAEFMQTGALTDETYAKLAEAGYSREIVDSYIAGQQAQAQLMQTEIEQYVGGADAMKGVLEWAAGNLSDGEKAAFNDIMDNGDTSAIKLAFDGLMAKYRAGEGSEGPLVSGSSRSGASSVKPFADNAQLTAAMRDPRYATSEAYRNEVAQRLAISNNFG